MKKMILLEEANHAIGLIDQHVIVSLEIMEKENEGILTGLLPRSIIARRGRSAERSLPRQEQRNSI